MTEDDRARWDDRYERFEAASDPHPPRAFADQLEHLPTSGTALEVACGRGEAAVWLGQRGLHVQAVDVSPRAIEQAQALARRHGVDDRCSFHVADLDRGLPAGEPVDLVLCHRFRAPKLYPALADRVAVGGLLAVAVLSEVGAEPGRFRAAPGELVAAFDSASPVGLRFEILHATEADGTASILARRR